MEFWVSVKSQSQDTDVQIAVTWHDSLELEMGKTGLSVKDNQCTWDVKSLLTGFTEAKKLRFRCTQEHPSATIVLTASTPAGSTARTSVSVQIETEKPPK